MGRLAAIYTRISHDDTGAQTSTTRQARLSRDWITAQGWDVAGVFEDVDRSAFRPGVVREGYERLLTEIAHRRVDVVVVWRLDRLARSPSEFERFWAACRAAGVEIASVTEPVDTTEPVGVAIVRMLVTFGGLESDVKSIRLQAANREAAAAGNPRTGGVPYGFNRDRTIIEPEAQLIREGATRVLDGEPRSLIADDWNRRGITKRRGGTWNPADVARVLTNRALAGDNTYRGDVVATGCWPAILDPATAAEVRFLVAGGRADSPQVNRSPALLRGLLRCGHCGAVMRCGGTEYRCQTAGCQRLGINRARTETWITDVVLNRLELRRGRCGEPRWDQTNLARHIAELDDGGAKLRVLNRAYFVTRDITRTEWTRARDDLLDNIDQQAARIAATQRPPGLPPELDLANLRGVWDELTPTVRQGVLALELAHAIVAPAQPGSRWQPERIEPHWRRADPPGWSVHPATSWRPVDYRRHLWWRTQHHPPASGGLEVDWLRLGGGPYSTAEAQRLTGLSRTTLWEARQRGLLPPMHRGNRAVYELVDLDRYLTLRNALPPRSRHTNRTETNRGHDIAERLRRQLGSTEWPINLPAATSPEKRAGQLSARDAATYLAIPVPTLYRLIRYGHLPAFRHGRAVHLHTADLETFIASSRIQPGTLRHLYTNPPRTPPATVPVEHQP